MKTSKKKRDASQFSVAKRWTPKLAKYWTPVARAFLERFAELKPPLTATEAMLVVQLVSFKWDEAKPFPSVATLAARMGCGDRNVRKMLKRLEGVGYVVRVERVGTSNLYDLSGLFRKLEQTLESTESNVVPIPAQRSRRSVAMQA
jgi:Helix-turn-helix domain